MSFPVELQEEITIEASNQPIVGYRCWLVEPVEDGYRLSGVLVPAPWAAAPGAWTEAACLPSGESIMAHSSRHPRFRVPDRDCSCGLHAYHSLAIGGFEFGPEQSRLWDEPLGIVWGVVAGAGRTVISEDGWRAQLARPVAMVSGSGRESHVRGVSEQLGIPIARHPDIGRLAVEFGQPWKDARTHARF